MCAHWQEERPPAEEPEEEVDHDPNKTPPRKARGQPACPNVKVAHRRLKMLAKSSWAPISNVKKVQVCRALYASVHGAKATSPFCDYLRELLETSPLRDLTNDSKDDDARTKFSVSVKRRLDTLFNESDESEDDSFGDKETCCGSEGGRREVALKA